MNALRKIQTPKFFPEILEKDLTKRDGFYIITMRFAKKLKNGGIAQLVEHPVHTRVVICSNQIAATRPVGQVVKTPPFHGGNMGSSPVRVTKNKTHRKVCLIFGIRDSNNCNKSPMQQYAPKFSEYPQ